MVIEIWADSFHEGRWACENLAIEIKERGGTASVTYDRGFIPVYEYSIGEHNVTLVVYGSYRSWSPVPEKVVALLDWGKPDFLAYLPDEDKILFAVEETAAVPTGNQALQRCERLLGSARSKIAFWYLLPEYGLHIDGGVRRDSIWPTLMALTLTQRYRQPCVVLHYADKDHPEDYSKGLGLRLLFRGLCELLLQEITEAHETSSYEAVLTEQYSDMLRFLSEQWASQIDFLPDASRLSEPEYSALLARQALGDSRPDRVLAWPRTQSLPDSVRAIQRGGSLLKDHDFARGLESSLDNGHAWRLSSRAGSRPQNEQSLADWLEKQQEIHRRCQQLTPAVKYPHSIEQFPVSQNGNRHVTTAPNILYLFDCWQEVLNLIEACFPRLRGRLDSTEASRPAVVYICNSVKPGRIFGDPFTGQLAAYSTIFSAGGDRIVMAWYPHQSHCQVVSGRRSSKGLTIMQEVLDYSLFAGGAMYMPKTGEIL